MMKCVGKETICTLEVKCERGKMKIFGIPEMWGKKRNIWGEYNVCKYVICQKTGLERSWRVRIYFEDEVEGCGLEQS